MYFFSQSHIKHLQHFNNPCMKQIYSLKFFQRPGSILRQMGKQPHISNHRVRTTSYFKVLNVFVPFQILILSSVRILLLLLNSFQVSKNITSELGPIYSLISQFYRQSNLRRCFNKATPK